MSRTGKTYTEEFRRNVVELLHSSGRPVSHVARELGVDVNSLRAWRNRILGQSAGSSFGSRRRRRTSWSVGRGDVRRKPKTSP